MRHSYPVPRATWIRSLALIAAAVAIAPVSTVRAEKSISESVLENKYQRGDYAIFMGVYDPNDWQFEQHADVAYPIGLKVRFRLGEGTWRSWLRLEGEVSYYRRANEPIAQVSVYQQPEFDGLMLAGTLQAVLPKVWFMRPYVGGGPMFVSLGNDYIVWRPDIYEFDPDNPDQYAMASWKKFDVGAQVIAGIDVPIGMRAFPFVEYRQMFGVIALSNEDVNINGLSLRFLGLEVEDIQTPPELEDRDEGGRPYEPQYDWGGPEVMFGVKILF